MAADAYEVIAEKIVDQIIEPVFISTAVGVRKGDDLTIGRANAGIARGREAQICLVPQIANAGVRRSELSRRIG